MLRITFLSTLLSFTSFAQTPGSGVIDIEGNAYSSVIIGSQEWMAENLKVKSFSTGDLIDNVTNSISWGNSTSPAWCSYENDNLNEQTYGTLYNWYVVVDSKNICPVGWHVPTRDEWDTLITNLGGQNIAGGAMKEIGTNYWSSPNVGATNASGFSGLPGGYRSNGSGIFSTINNGGFWWSSTPENNFAGYSVYLYYNDETAPIASANNKDGLSIRCIKPASSAGLINLDKTTKTIIKISDLMGRETSIKPNSILIYLYSDGTTEKVYIGE